MVGAGGGSVSSMLITELSTYVLGSKGMLLSARCKTEVGPRWSHMLPHSRVIILPFSLAQSLGLVREMGLSFSELRMSQVWRGDIGRERWHQFLASLK